MNRWETLAQETRRRVRLGGDYINDWPSGGGLVLPPPGALPGGGALAPILPVTSIGRNLTQQEADASDMANRLIPPALTIAKQHKASALAAAITPGGELQTISPAWSQQPAGGQPFTFLNAAAVTLPAIGAVVVVVTFQVPRRKNGIIEFVANQFVGGGWTEGTGDLIWRITADGVPVQGYDNLIASIGTLVNPGWLGTRPIRIYENQVIALTLTNVAVVVAAQPLLGLFRGGFYPIEQEGQNQAWL